MNFSDLPRSISRDKYVEAIEKYDRQVRHRAVALYQVGAIAFPGISDLDLLVVVSEDHADNNQFFSAMDRLPHHFRSLFLHEPFILPIKALTVIKHTSHRPRLINGRDILNQNSPMLTREERWCKLLESYCNFKVFLDQCEVKGSISGRLTVAVASSMRYALADFDELYSSDYSAAYAAKIDSNRALLTSKENEAEKVVAEIWAVFRQTFVWLEATIMRLLGLRSDEMLQRFSREFLRGRRTIDSLDQSWVANRSDSIDCYNAELRRMHFSYGHLFFFAAYGKTVPRYDQPRLARIFYALRYRLAASSI